MTMLPPRRTPYFVAGGTLGPHIPSYVKRPSDDELFEHVMMGEMCYVLTPRQMGKSSLVARTIVRLKNENIAAANIDLQDSGGLDEDTFYLNTLDELRRAFELDIVVEDWWDENGRFGASLRFRRFFTDYLLPQINGRVVIFIDEIDTMLTMSFRDNFFAAIRALFNGRASNPELERLTFVLLGVASPSELIKDPDRTPFNIGTKINLQEFEPNDAEPLLRGLKKEHPKQAKAILERIFHWTSGHPYLTQQLCLLITQKSEDDWDDTAIDTLVRQTFLSDESRNEDNIKLIQSRIDGSPKKRQLLKLYKKVYLGKIVKEDKASVAQNQLLLSGLVSLINGRLQVRNQIYRNVFNQSWIRRETEINWGLVAIASSLVILVAAVSMVVFNLVIQPNRQRNYENQYIFAESVPTESAALGKLACMQPFLFGNSIDFDRRVSSLFFERESWEEQKLTYDYRHFNDHPQGLVCIVQDIYASLVDHNLSSDTTPMLQIMADNLRQIEYPDAETLIRELDFWITGRELLQQSNFDQAVEAYSAAIEMNSNNPATLFERARVYTILGNNSSSTDLPTASAQYNLALADLDRVVSFILLQPDSPSAAPTSTATQLPTPTRTTTLTNTIGPLATPAIMATLVSTDTISPVATTLAAFPPPALSPRFNTPGQWLNLVEDFLQSEPGLATALKNTENPENAYPSLSESGLNNTSVLVFAGQISDANGIWRNDYVVVLFKNGIEIARTTSQLLDSPLSGQGPMDGVFELRIDNEFGLTSEDGYLQDGAPLTMIPVNGVGGQEYIGTWFVNLTPNSIRVIEVLEKQLEYSLVILPMPLDELPEDYSAGNLSLQGNTLLTISNLTEGIEGAVTPTQAATTQLTSDEDEDGLTFEQETTLGTNPLAPDTDGDGLTDGQEVNQYGTNPLLADSDGDGINDVVEISQGTDPSGTPSATSAPVEKIIFLDYLVQEDDTLFSIAQRIDTSVSLMSDFGISEVPIPGQVIKLPVGNPAFCQGRGRPYAVGEGDTAFNIAQRFNTTAVNLQSLNGLDTNFTLEISDIICVP